VTLTARLPRPVPGPATPWRLPAAHRSTLACGLRVVRYELPGQLLAAAALVLDAPPELEPMSLEGLATILARTFDEGTEHRDGAAFAAEMDRVGAAYNPSVNTSGIYLNLDAPVRFFGSALRLLAEAVTLPTFPEAEVERHVKQRLGELAQEDATASSLAGRWRLVTCFRQDSRYSRPVGGLVATVGGISRDAIELFYRKSITPARATLVLAGDFRGMDIESTVETAFGSWTAEGSSDAEGRTPVSCAPRAIIADRPGAVQSHLAFGFAGPDRNSRDWADLLVAGRVLGGGVTSRLSASLREDKGYTYGIQAGFTPFLRGGLFTIDTAVQTDATAPAVAEVFAVTEKFHAEGPTPDECAEAIDFITGIHPLQHQTARAIASSAAMQVGFGVGDFFLDDLQDALRSVTPASAAAAFRKHVDAADLSLVVAGDAASIQPTMRIAVTREIKVITL
jgi:zinc protease